MTTYDDFQDIQAGDLTEDDVIVEYRSESDEWVTMPITHLSTSAQGNVVVSFGLVHRQFFLPESWFVIVPREEQS